MNESHTLRARKARGFTLIEIMVVIVIIGLIVGIVAPGIMGQLSRAEAQTARADIQRISTALDLFRTTYYRYPTAEEGLEILLGDGEIDGEPVDEFITASSIPKDPWGREYRYDNPSNHGDRYDVYTLGADGREGGEDDNADIGTWNIR